MWLSEMVRRWRARGLVETPVSRRRLVKNHCELATPRETPEGVLRELRALDPAYDLHYLGNGVWTVGRVVRNRERAESAGKIHKRRDQDGRAVRKFSQIALPQLHMQGFGIVAVYDIQGEPDGRIVTDVRAREWLFHNRADREFTSRLDSSNGIADVAGVTQGIGSDAWWDDIAYRERHIQPELFRGRKHFTQGTSHH